MALEAAAARTRSPTLPMLPFVRRAARLVQPRFVTSRRPSCTREMSVSRSVVIACRRYGWALAALAVVGGVGWLVLPHPAIKSRYVAGNRAVLESVPSYPGSRSSITGSGSISDGDYPLAPTIAYTTVREDRFARRVDEEASLGWYRQRLRARGWQIRQETPAFYFNARRGEAYVQVMVGDQGATLIADHRCYAGREPRCF